MSKSCPFLSRDNKTATDKIFWTYCICIYLYYACHSKSTRGFRPSCALHPSQYAIFFKCSVNKYTFTYPDEGDNLQHFLGSKKV